MTSETTQPAGENKSGPAKPIETPKPKPAPRPTVGAVLSALGLMLMEIVLPALASGALLLWVFGSYNFWQIGRSTALVLFAIVMVVVSLLLAVVLDSVTAPILRGRGLRRVRFVKDPRTRIIKLALGGLVVPLIVFFAVNYVPFASHGTLMNYLITRAVPPVKVTPPDEVAAIALGTDNPATKIASIQVLQGFNSTEALNQLLRMVNEDPKALADPGVSDALSNAIAAYAGTARDALLSDFKSIDPTRPGTSTGVSADLYDRYFAPSFDSLKGEITNQTADPAARDAQLAQLQAAQAQLKTALTGMAYTPAKTAGEDPRLQFILQTFQAMKITQDADLLAFARATAADPRYSSPVRGDALLLVGKLGDQKDLDLLYTYMRSKDNLLVNRALQAVAAIQSRAAGTNSK